LTELKFLDYRVHGVFLLFFAFGESGFLQNSWAAAGVEPGAVQTRTTETQKLEAGVYPTSSFGSQLRISIA
jgi:hypothetical protein